LAFVWNIEEVFYVQECTERKDLT